MVGGAGGALWCMLHSASRMVHGWRLEVLGFRFGTWGSIVLDSGRGWGVGSGVHDLTIYGLLEFRFEVVVSRIPKFGVWSWVLVWDLGELWF